MSPRADLILKNCDEEEMMKIVKLWTVKLWIVPFLLGAAVGQSTVTPLQSLIAEARQNNASIIASEMAVVTGRYAPGQVSALPDTEFMLQHFSVGSPRPFLPTATATLPTWNSAPLRKFHTPVSVVCVPTSLSTRSRFPVLKKRSSRGTSSHV